MTAGNIETFHEGDKWHNRVEGQNGSTHHAYDTQQEAVDAGQKLAQDAHVEHIIMNSDGTVGERKSYLDEPHSNPA